MSEKDCWIILPKKVNIQYRSESLLKQISLEMFLKNFRIQKKIPVPESFSKVAGCFQKETLTQVFICKFHKIFKNSYVLWNLSKDLLLKQLNFRPLFLKELVAFNCLSLKIKKNWHFLIHPTWFLLKWC